MFGVALSLPTTDVFAWQHVPPRAKGWELCGLYLQWRAEYLCRVATHPLLESRGLSGLIVVNFQLSKSAQDDSTH